MTKDTEAYRNFIDLVRQRYSCREYDSDRHVEPHTVQAVIEAARLAPSACNRQPWTFVAITDPEIKATVLAKSRPSFLQAPVIIAACGHHDQVWVRPSDNKDHTDVDISIAVEHICLAATSLGLATCWVCSFDVQATRQALSLPDSVEPVALIPLGYPANPGVPEKNRKDLDQILRWEKF